MKISPPIEAVAAELEDLARVSGWKAVAKDIADQYHADGGGEVLPEVDTGDGLKNAEQRVKRIFRGFDGPRYAPQAEVLKAAALAILPADRRMHLESPGDPILLATEALKEGTEAVNAVHLRAAPAVALKEIDEAMSKFTALKLVIEALCHADAREVYRGSYV